MFSKKTGQVSASIAFFAFADGCAPLRLPERSSGPTKSREGVELAVNRQSCTQNVDPDFNGRDLVEEVVVVQIRNATDSLLTVRRDAIRLVAPDGTALRTVTWRAGDLLAMSGGESRSLKLRFMARGALACTQEMKLDADAGLRMNGHPIGLGAINFVPDRAL